MTDQTQPGTYTWDDDDYDKRQPDDSDSSHDASSDRETYHESCWKRDRRLHPVAHIPRLPSEAAKEMHDVLTKKTEVEGLAFVKCTPDSMRTCIGENIKYYFPIISWLPELLADANRKEILKADVIAGLTVGVMAIPQSMSYADIAGLPYIFGMYSIMITCMIYGICGNSKQLGIGPVAMVSLIVEAGLAEVMSEEECPAWFDSTLNPTGEGQARVCPKVYQEYVFLCSFLVGIINIVGGMLNLGFLVNFLAHPVISGFTSGAAIIIGFSQVKYVLGFDIEKSQYIYVTISEIFKNIGDTKPVVLIFGIFWIAGLHTLKWLADNKPAWKKFKPFGPLIFCTVGILICWIFPVLTDDYHVDIVKDIPEGFPPLSVDKWDFGKLSAVMSTAISASLIGYMESIAISKALATKHKYKLDAGYEMVALGTTNLVGSAFSCYPVTGSFSRSAVNDNTGALTQTAGLVTSFIMLLTLMVLTPLFYYLPKFALAAIVINSVKKLVAYDEPLHLWKVKKTDCALWFCAFLGTLFLGIQLGIGLAVVLSIFFLIHESAFPQMSILWRLPHTHVYSNIKTTTHGSFVPGVIVVRLMGSIYFANCGYIRDKIDNYLDEVEEKKIDKVKYLVLSLSACTSVDTSAIDALKELQEDLTARGVQLAFAQVGNRVWKSFEAGGIVKKVGLEWIHDSCHDAVQHCLAFDASHITDDHHYENLEKTMNRITVGPDDVQLEDFTSRRFSVL